MQQTQIVVSCFPVFDLGVEEDVVLIQYIS